MFDRVGGALGLVGGGFALGWLLAGQPAAGQVPSSSAASTGRVICKSFTIEAPEDAPTGPRKLLVAITEVHMAQVQTWLDEQTAAGHPTPVYLNSIGLTTAGGIPLSAEIICVR